MSGFPTDKNSKEAMNTVKTYLEMALSTNSAGIDKALQNAHDAVMSKSVSVDEGISQMNTNVKPLLSK
jgi:multiple sugar transport system substrate-binding protein